MGAQLRVLRQRIKSIQSTKKITSAMELIAASRIVRAQNRIKAAEPYTTEITRMLSALGTKAGVDHPLVVPREQARRAAVLVITSDRGLAGGYNANVLRAAENLMDQLRNEGVEPVRFLVGRKGTGYYRFRHREIAESWTGFSEQPTHPAAREISELLGPLFLAGSETTPLAMQREERRERGDAEDSPLDAPDMLGVDRLYVVGTRFKSALSQVPYAELIAPVSVGADEEQEAPATHDSDVDALQPVYEFEPSPESLLASMLPRYLTTRIYAALLSAAAAESAARRRAMKSATDNATDLIKTLNRESNQARQAEITQEISEIVGGADALAATGSDD